MPTDTVLVGAGILQGYLSIDRLPLDNFNIVIYRSDGSVASQLKTDDNGYFETTLPSGYYTVQANVANQIHNYTTHVIKDSIVVENMDL